MTAAAVLSTPTGETKRDFLVVATWAATAVGTAAAVWPMIDSMNPSADVLALSVTEADIASVAEGQAITVVWQAKPVFIRHRTAAEVSAAAAVNVADLRDPQTDAERTQRPEWLVVIGICTHLGCIPIGYKGDFDGWFCPCHGSHYDTSGRVRRGPAPRNLDVPPYAFLTDTIVRVG